MRQSLKLFNPPGEELTDGRLTEKWRQLLAQELQYRNALTGQSTEKLTELCKRSKLLSGNIDTGVSLDFPHYCTGATPLCGGPRGWCYTFSGRHCSEGHHQKVALIDVLSVKEPELLAATVLTEVDNARVKGLVSSMNLRYAGSGEVAPHHLPALKIISSKGIKLWGFTKRLDVALSLRAIGASVLFSWDSSSKLDLVQEAVTNGFQLAYTSADALDRPEIPSFVVFPLHRQGRVREVVDCSNLCPKVVEEYLTDTRRPGACQSRCTRCHEAGAL